MKRKSLRRLFSSVASAILTRGRQLLAQAREIPRKSGAGLFVEMSRRWPGAGSMWRQQAHVIENRAERLVPRHPDAALAELIAWHKACGTLGQLFTEYPDLHS